MKRVCVALFLFNLCFVVFSQNLVLNPSFENYTSCPAGPTEFTKCVDWDDTNSGADSCSSPDLFNTCCTSPIPLFPPPVGVPLNLLGSQNARTGNGYAGIILREAFALMGCNIIPGTPAYREYLQGRLSSPLVAGTEYCVEFYISLAGNVKWGTNQIGVYFSPTQVQYEFCTQSHPLNVTPQLEYSGAALMDTSTWVLLSWNYTAVGGEQYIVIGNFKNDANSPLTDSNCGSMNPYCYYYIEDVSVAVCGSTPTLYAHAGPDDEICANESVTIGDTPAASGGNPPYNYAWSPTTGLSNPNIANPVASPSVTTTYILTVTDDDSNTAMDTVIVTVHDLPIVDLGPDIVMCILETDTLDAGAGFVDYDWNTLESTQTIIISAAGNYSVTVTDANNCTNSDQITVTTTSQYDASIIPSGPYCETASAVTLAAVNSGGLWSGNGITNTSLGTFDPGVAGIGTHLITYFIAGACGDSDTAEVSVIDCSEPEHDIYVPNVFSPNGDGENDILFVRGDGILYLEFVVYNRWGEKIFESSSQTIGWNGMYKDKPCPSGVYTWYVKVTFNGNTEEYISGNTTLIR